MGKKELHSQSRRGLHFISSQAAWHFCPLLLILSEQSSANVAQTPARLLEQFLSYPTLQTRAEFSTSPQERDVLLSSLATSFYYSQTPRK